jgi:hypothetical protein
MKIVRAYQQYRESMEVARDYLDSNGVTNRTTGEPQRTTWSVRPEWGQTADDEDD